MSSFMRTDGKTERDGQTDRQTVISCTFFESRCFNVKGWTRDLQHPAENICGAYHIVFDVRMLSAGQSMALEL